VEASPGFTSKDLIIETADRLIAGIKHFQPILAAAKARDAGEADTVTIVTNMLGDVFGYDKFAEVTSEHSIKGTYCDLAIKSETAENKIQTLIEVKAIGLDLKEAHVKQAIDYAANQGVTWVVLTNAVTWRIYKVTYEKPIGQDLVVEIDFLSLKPKADFEHLYLWCKEAWGASSALDEFEARKQALSRFLIGAVIRSDTILDAIRRELKRVSLLNKVTVDVKIDVDQIEKVIEEEVLKREILEGPKADEAVKKVAKAAGKLLKKASNKEDAKAQADAPPDLPPATA
jgi:predicted type IV restriction endonuclease